jgi:hypothetical protein
MTGTALLVAAPWAVFAAGLAADITQLVRARHSPRQPENWKDASGPSTPEDHDARVMAPARHPAHRRHVP